MEISTIQLDCTTFLTIKGTEYRQMPIDEIIALQSMDKYVEIITTCTKFYVLTSLKSISKYLTNFIEVNKGFIINKYYISKLTKQVKDKSKYDLVMSDGAKDFWSVEVSDYTAKKILEQL